MTLNLPRSQSRLTLASAVGTAIAMGTMHVPAELFDGVTQNDQEAKEMAFRVNAARDRAKFAAKAKKGLTGVLGGK